jgi:catechol 2,3-dioxygenase-like lactoylglutathione lyase family enzyme
MPGRGIQHVDLAVSDVERSLAFYRELLVPLPRAWRISGANLVLAGDSGPVTPDLARWRKGVHRRGEDGQHCP